MVKYTLSKINRVKYTHTCLVAWQNLTPKTKSYRKKDLKCVLCRPSSIVHRPPSIVRHLYLLSSHVSTLVHRISNFTLRSIHGGT